MKRLACLLFVLLVAAVSASCGKSESGSINPGDKVGGFQVTIGTGDDVSYLWDWEADCIEQGEGTSCKVGIGAKVNVSWGIYASVNKDLDTTWSEHTYKMFINDRPVNLEAFGSVDIVYPVVGKMRLWNVVIVADKPGTIVIRTEGVAGGDPFGEIKTLIFTAP